jgi:hypothetical protein
MLRTMKARFPGRCKGCSSPIVPGDLIAFVRSGVSYHQDCEKNKKVNTIYFPSSNTTIYRNAKGTCEDAPCCGCCTF